MTRRVSRELAAIFTGAVLLVVLAARLPAAAADPGETTDLPPAAPFRLVPADHWAYAVLYRLAARGVAPLWAASTRPLTRLAVARMVAAALAQVEPVTDPARAGAALSPADREDLAALAREFAPELMLLDAAGGRDAALKPAAGRGPDLSGGAWKWSLGGAITGRLDAGDRPRWEWRGDAFALDRLYLAAGAAGRTLFRAPADLAVQAGRDLHWWGPGHGGAFVLSGNAGPLDTVTFAIAWDRLRFLKHVAPLDAGRTLYAMRYDWLLRDNLRVGISDAIMATGPLYIPYLLTPIPGSTSGMSNAFRVPGGFNDNYNLGLDFDWRLRPGVLLYGELYVDDATLPDNPFPHRVGGTFGLFLADPFRDGRTSLWLEHSRATNWIYATGDRRTDHILRDRALGHWCAPDCALWSAEAAHRLAPGRTLTLRYDLIRKGEGALGDTWTGLGDAWDRLYLSGVVETTHAVTLALRWAAVPAAGRADGSAPGLAWSTTSITWAVSTNAAHIPGAGRQTWYLKWEASLGF